MATPPAMQLVKALQATWEAPASSFLQGPTTSILQRQDPKKTEPRKYTIIFTHLHFKGNLRFCSSSTGHQGQSRSLSTAPGAGAVDMEGSEPISGRGAWRTFFWELTWTIGTMADGGLIGYHTLR